MPKMDTEQEVFEKAFLKVFDSKEGQIIFDYLTFKYQDNIQINVNNVNDNYYKLGKFEMVRYLKNLFTNLKYGKNNGETKIEY